MYKSTTIQHQEFWLLHQRALFWPAKQTLIIADVHLGKTSHFRKNGLALPVNIPFAEIENLNKLVEEYKPETIIFLGDLFHSDVNQEWNLFIQWLSQYAFKAILVNGNHDTALLQETNLGKLISVNQQKIENFLFTHEPTELHENLYNFCGHIHPGFTLKGKGHQKLRLPCFSVGKMQTILPAFGLTTGAVAQKQKAQNRFFVIAENEVFEVNKK